MSSASDFRTKVQAATVYEVLGKSGASYLVFWFRDGSVCAARKLPSGNRAAARLEFGETKPCLDDCGVADFAGTTYQKGTELLRRLERVEAATATVRHGALIHDPTGGRMSKYEPLRHFLENVETGVSELTLSFGQIESILAARLPPSARKHRAWWSNPSSPDYHPNARAWLSAGWRVDGVDQREERVRFRRSA